MKRVKLWSESPEKHVILLCFQSEALTLTSKVSQPLLQGGLEKMMGESDPKPINQKILQICRKFSFVSDGDQYQLFGCSFLISLSTPLL